MKLIHGDSLSVLSKLPDNCVDCVVTSPPYAKQREYTGYAADDFDKFLLPIMSEVLRVLKPTGSAFVNIKEHCHDGQRSLYVYKLIIALTENRWRFVDEFVWQKTNPFPTGSKRRLKDGWERVYHLTKSKDYRFYPDSVLIKSESKWLDSEKRRKNKGDHNTNNGSGMNMSKRVVTDMVRPSNVLVGSTSNINIAHPAVFPEYLPEFFIKLSTTGGDVVLDPFAGSGTTGVVCSKIGRSFIGIDNHLPFIELARSRLNDSSPA